VEGDPAVEKETVHVPAFGGMRKSQTLGSTTSEAMGRYGTGARGMYDDDDEGVEGLKICNSVG
jgi:hypothetical protein